MECPPNQKASLLLLLLLLLGLFLEAQARSKYQPEDVDVSWNMDTQPADDLLQRMRVVLMDNEPQLTVQGHTYLAPKQVVKGRSPPCRWIRLHLVAGGARVTLALDDALLYLIALRNRTDDWNCFPGYESFFPQCTVLPFTETYGSLLPSPDKKENKYTRIARVPLGKAAAIRSARLLSGYPETTTQDDAKVSIASFVLMISEALRMVPIREVFTGQKWDTETFLSTTDAKLVDDWGITCYCVYLWDKNGVWPSRKECASKKRNPQDALAMLDLMQRPNEISIERDIY